MTIDDLELSVRTSNCLGRDMSVERFLSLTKAEVMALKNAGIRTWREVEAVQKSLTKPTRSEAFHQLRGRLARCAEDADVLGLQIVLIGHNTPRLAKIYGA